MTQISGTVAGVPFVARSPEPAGRTDQAPVVVLWHLLGAPGTPAAMASSLPLNDVPAWRVYLELPGSGSRPGPGVGDLLLDRYAPIIEQAVTELPAVLAELRTEFAMDDGPIALVGGSAGGHAALVATVRGPVDVAATAVINPAVRAESVMAVNERVGGVTYEWSKQSRAAAAQLDVLAHTREIPAANALLLLTGDDEYPEFQPDQAALHEAVAATNSQVKQRVIAGLAHMFADEPGNEPTPPTPEALAIDAEITDWLNQHFLKTS